MFSPSPFVGQKKKRIQQKVYFYCMDQGQNHKTENSNSLCSLYSLHLFIKPVCVVLINHTELVQLISVVTEVRVG